MQRCTGRRDMEHGARKLWKSQVGNTLDSLIIISSLPPVLKLQLNMHVNHFRPVHGLIFLFKWQPGEEPAGSIVQDSRLEQIFFAKQVHDYAFHQIRPIATKCKKDIQKIIFANVLFQVINNACATQAIVSVLLNCTHPDMHLGETLTEFREFSQSFDAAVS